ncbi:MAG: hypothetical protein MI725_03235, partial [Pirellulales bacterium]|nr:hypothetical protein [Pirellulales bacterium]
MNELSEAQCQRWRAIQQSRPELDSPFFAPDFSALVAEELPDLQVAVLSTDGQTVGFFPHHRSELGLGKPVGMLLNDFQGIVCTEPGGWDTRQLLSACRLKSWRFNHLIASQHRLASSPLQTDASPYISISEDFQAYHKACRQAGSRLIDQALRKQRKLRREQGP